MSISLGVVIPLTVEQVEKARERGERELVVSHLKTLQQTSYFYSRPLTVKFSGATIKTTVNNEERDFESTLIFFEAAEIELIPMGMNSEFVIDASIGERKWKLSLNENQATWSVTY